jgi:hypothetical protein
MPVECVWLRARPWLIERRARTLNNTKNLIREERNRDFSESGVGDGGGEEEVEVIKGVLWSCYFGNWLYWVLELAFDDYTYERLTTP